MSNVRSYNSRQTNASASSSLIVVQARSKVRYRFVASNMFSLTQSNILKCYTVCYGLKLKFSMKIHDQREGIKSN